MKKNRVALISIIAVLLLGIGASVYFYLNSTDKKTTLTVLEQRWIEKNKEEVIDIEVLNNLPIFGYEGNGIFFDFLTDFEKDTKLEFNKVSYNMGEKPTMENAFKVSNEVKDGDILIYEDQFEVIGLKKHKLNNLKELDGKTAGVLQEDQSNVSYYLGDEITYTPAASITDLMNALDSGTIDYMIIPSNAYRNQILAKDNYYVAAHLNDVSKKYVLSLTGDDDKLKSIISKYYKKWSKENLKTAYNTSYFDLYTSVKKIDDKDKAEFKSKRYVYGVVNNTPFEHHSGNKIIGMNSKYIQGFMDFTGVEFSFKSYKSISDLRNALVNGDVDLAFKDFDAAKLGIKFDETVSPYDESFIIATNLKSEENIDTIKSLKDKEVMVVKDSYIETYLRNNTDCKIKTYETTASLMNSVNEKSIIATDAATYDLYKGADLANFKISYQGNMNYQYTFMVRKDDANTTFSQIFSYYLDDANNAKLNNEGLASLESIGKRNAIGTVLIYLLAIAGIIAIVAYVYKKRGRKTDLTKQQRLKYIDMLTSLKNRNYLNHHIEEWEANKIYPQSIVVIDLNNVKYINDNYGHEEGDNVIRAAASILIKTQLENSDIMRTDGNEFLIYLVGYEEKQVVAYTRKLYKEFQELPHGFGAALGFSMIEDDIKTIDDAINEATLEMRSNKNK